MFSCLVCLTNSRHGKICVGGEALARCPVARNPGPASIYLRNFSDYRQRIYTRISPFALSLWRCWLEVYIPPRVTLRKVSKKSPDHFITNYKNASKDWSLMQQILSAVCFIFHIGFYILWSFLSFNFQDIRVYSEVYEIRIVGYTPFFRFIRLVSPVHKVASIFHAIRCFPART